MMRKRRRGGAGLARAITRTAVVAGTARAVAGPRAVHPHAAPRPGVLTDEIVDQLKKLAELRDAGVLSAKEFSAKKAKLLP